MNKMAVSRNPGRLTGYTVIGGIMKYVCLGYFDESVGRCLRK